MSLLWQRHTAFIIVFFWKSIDKDEIQKRRLEYFGHFAVAWGRPSYPQLTSSNFRLEVSKLASECNAHILRLVGKAFKIRIEWVEGFFRTRRVRMHRTNCEPLRIFWDGNAGRWAKVSCTVPNTGYKYKPSQPIVGNTRGTHVEQVASSLISNNPQELIIRSICGHLCGR